LNADRLAEVLRADLPALAPELKLETPLDVAYVPNLGGLVNANFTVTTPSRAYHLKLAADADSKQQLRNWQRVGAQLADRYRAPRMLGWIDVPGTDWSGAVFERAPGASPARAIPARVLEQMVPLVDALHADEQLASLVSDGGPPPRARDTFLAYHTRICRSDLEELTEDDAFPPFVDDALVGWMRDEVARLGDIASSSDAFAERVTSVIHNDLWFGNVVIDGDDWWIVDWDRVALGDPAHDLSMLLFTALDDGADPSRWLAGRDDAFVERFELGRRAMLLDFVVDSLADWAEADAVPSVADATRANREQFHRWALARYRALYG
jgi:aminoglycoside phosphotransferase (APT) family kinase protein